jgi:galactokinase
MTISARLEQAGMNETDAAAIEARFARVTRALDERSGPASERVGWFVPGRVEVLGKHTDYAGGRTLICAAGRGFCAAAAGRRDDRVTITDAARGSTFVISLSPDAAAGGDQRWFTYPATVVRRIARNFPSARRGADIVFESDLPSAAGMSSSSALMVAVLLAIADLNALEHHEAWARHVRHREDLASFAATIENGRTFGTLDGDGGVGTAGGSEDHTAILCGRAGHLSQYSFLPVRFERAIPVDRGLVFAIGASGIVANKIGEARERYNAASSAVSAIVERWRRSTGRHDESLAAALSSGPDAADRIRAIIHDAGREAPRLMARFDQFVEESEGIVPAAGDALSQGDLHAFGALVDRSQTLAERLLGNQVPETVALARAARAHGAYAASAFGAGFGGSVWALVDAGSADRFVERWSASYRDAFPVVSDRAQFFVTRPGPAAMRLEP